MIYVDDRAGSKDYAPLLPKSELCRLDYGDVCFAGNGPHGDVLVGLELKQLSDVLNCIMTGRFADVQAPGMVKAYDYSWLIIEGSWNCDPDGMLVVPRRNRGLVPVALGRRRFMYRDLEQWLASVEMQAGIRVRCTKGKQETVATILGLYHWFQKDYDEHKTFKCFHQDGPDSALLSRPTLTRRIAAELPSVGWRWSMVAEKAFETVGGLCGATIADWAALELRGKVRERWRFGMTNARKVVKAIHGDGIGSKR